MGIVVERSMAAERFAPVEDEDEWSVFVTRLVSTSQLSR